MENKAYSADKGDTAGQTAVPTAVAREALQAQAASILSGGLGAATSNPPRAQVLQSALQATLGDRNRTYGKPKTNLDVAHELCRLYHNACAGRYSGAHDQAIYLALHKIARIACGAALHRDNYVDASAYMAIAFECEDEAARTVGSALKGLSTGVALNTTANPATSTAPPRASEPIQISEGLRFEDAVGYRWTIVKITGSSFTAVGDIGDNEQSFTIRSIAKVLGHKNTAPAVPSCVNHPNKKAITGRDVCVDCAIDETKKTA